MSDAASVLDSMVDRADQLYSLPGVAVRVLDLTSQENVDAHQLKQCIENDPALTAKLLRVVNSSLFGLATPVSDLTQALALLGIKPLKLLVLGFSLPPKLMSEDGEVFRRYWQHTLTRAVAAREICLATRCAAGDELFIAALLRDVGILVLAQQAGPAYLAVWRKTADRPALREAERAALGFDHSQLTQRLMEHWKLPATLVESVSLPTDAEAVAKLPKPSRTAAKVLRLAELVAGFLAGAGPPALGEAYAQAMDFFGIDDRQLRDLVAQLQPKVVQLADVLSLKLPPGLDYQALIAQAHQRLSQVASEVVEDSLRKRGVAAATAPCATAGDELRLLAEAAKCLKTARSAPAGARSEKAKKPVAAAAGREKARALKSAPAADGKEPAAAARPSATAVAGDEPLLLEAVSSAVARCRARRMAASLLLVELDGYGELVFQAGLPKAEELLRQFESALFEAAQIEADPEPIESLRTRDSRFAVVVPFCERGTIVRLANKLLVKLRRVLDTQAGAARGRLRVCLGAATVPAPSATFPPQDLMRGAARCLGAALSAHGDGLKSIEIY
ncbi:MAG: HDOD domain-containing protein [Planctomycetia bacterium]|nr:HDOD domain-containing protein [Planctomycetia bacterium]